MRPYPLLSFLLLGLSIRALVSDAAPRCMPHGSGGAQLRIIDPPAFASITLPVTITVCVPPHLLRSESADYMNASLLLTVNTLVFNQSGIRPEVIFSVDQSVSENLNVGMVAYPSLEFCVYIVAAGAEARPHFDSSYSCVLTSASSPSPCPLTNRHVDCPSSRLICRLQSGFSCRGAIRVNVRTQTFYIGGVK